MIFDMNRLEIASEIAGCASQVAVLLGVQFRPISVQQKSNKRMADRAGRYKEGKRASEQKTTARKISCDNMGIACALTSLALLRTALIQRPTGLTSNPPAPNLAAQPAVSAHARESCDRKQRIRCIPGSRAPARAPAPDRARARARARAPAPAPAPAPAVVGNSAVVGIACVLA